MPTVSINAEYLRLAQLFTSKDDMRYYLKGVQVEPHPTEEGILIIATSGHVAGVFYDREGYVKEPMLIAFDKPFLASLKQDKNEKGVRRVTVRGDRLVTMSTDIDGELFEEKHIKPGDMLIDGTFPDWRRIIPKPDNNACVPCFDAKFIVLFQQVARSLSGCKVSPLKLTSSDVDAPIAVTVSHNDFFGVLMPMKGSNTASSPSWLLAEGTL